MTWYISVVKIYRNEKGEVQMEKIKEVKWVTPVAQEQRTVPILKDVGNPSFHWHSSVSYDTIYTEEEVNKLLEGGVDPALSEDLLDQ